MTSVAEIKKWVRPLLAADPRLTLVGRHLILTPVRHILRGIFIDRTSDRRRVRLICHVAPLFESPAHGSSFAWSFTPPVGMTDQSDFSETFVATCRDAIDCHLERIDSVSAFLDEADGEAERIFSGRRISRYPLRFAVMLASVGQLAKACEVLAPTLLEDEARYARLLASARAKLERRPGSAIAKDDLSLAEHQLRVVCDLRRLQPLLEQEDLKGVATLLGEWERQGARLWEVEHLWQPTAFSFELGAGD